MKNNSNKIVENLKKQAEKITLADVQKVTDNLEKIKEKFSPDGALGKFVQNAKLMMSMVKDYQNGSYRKVPWAVVAAVVFTLLYVFNPFDLVPDFIPFFGYVDDAGVIYACLQLVEMELNEYKEWLNKNNTASF